MMLLWLWLGCTGVSESKPVKEKPEPEPASVDADGDGYFSVESGGDDCADGDAQIHPGAEEVCDGVDQDCDGVVYAGGCGEAQWWESVGRVIVKGMAIGTEAALVEDLTGDGKADLLQPYRGNAYEAYDETYGVLVFDLLDELNRSSYSEITDAEYGLFSQYWDLVGTDARDFGDVNGDGLNDIGNMTYSGFIIYKGNFCCDFRYMFDDELENIYDGINAHVPEYGLGTFVTAQDYDQDGRDDIVVAAPGGFNGSWDTSMYVFWGTFQTMRTIIGQDPDTLVRLGDFDGDGIPDFGDTAGYWFSGNDMAASTDITLYQDLYAGQWSSLDEPDAPGLSSMAAVGDWTGDGQPDLLLSSSTAAGDRGRIWLMTGAPVGTVGLSGAAATMESGEAPVAGFGAQMTVGELDGEAGLEALIYAERAETTYVLTGSRLGAGFGQDAEAGCWRVAGMAPYVETADVTGDGIEDWVGTDTKEFADTILVPGWPIPWDDPAAW